MTTNTNTRGWGIGVRRGLAALALFGAVVATLTSCGSSCNESQVTFDWVVTQNGVEVGCPPGSGVSIMVDNVSMIADYDCTAFAGTTLLIQGGGGTHRISLQLSDSAGNELSSLSTSVGFPCSGGIVDLGTVEFSLTP